VTSSNTTVGVLVNSPQVQTGNGFCTNTSTGGMEFDPLAVGSSTLTLVTPSGFTTPSNFQSIVATVAAAGISVGGNTALGKDLQEAASGTLQAPAAAGGVVVTLTSSDPSKLLIAPNATTAGSPSIDVTVAAGQTSFSYVLQSLAGTGTVQVIASAPGYVNGAGDVTLVPSGFIINSPGGTLSTSQVAANTSIQLCATSLNPATLAYDGFQSRLLRFGIAPVSVAVTSSNTTVGVVVNSPQSQTGNSFCTNTSTGGMQFDPLAAGTTTLTLVTPSGFTTPSNFQSVAVTVN
jgi:hypothetical protein